jgi:hexosaminidase
MKHFRLGPGVCPKVVARGFRCIMSNQGVWYLDHLDVPWEDVYSGEPLDGISDKDQQKLVLGGEVCMWGETADTSDVLQTIWPRAAAAAGTRDTSWKCEPQSFSTPSFCKDSLVTIELL